MDLTKHVEARESEAGASLVEYALLVALIALVCVVAVTYFGSSVNGQYSNFGSLVDQSGR